MISELELSREIVRSIAGKTTRKIAIGTVYPATIGVLPSFLSRIGRKYPDIRMAGSLGFPSVEAVIPNFRDRD